MANLSAYIHSKGLKFGIYTSKGATTCLKRNGSYFYETIDANTYVHDWDVDAVKDDGCGNRSFLRSMPEIATTSVGTLSIVSTALLRTCGAQEETFAALLTICGTKNWT